MANFRQFVSLDSFISVESSLRKKTDFRYKDVDMLVSFTWSMKKLNRPLSMVYGQFLIKAFCWWSIAITIREVRFQSRPKTTVYLKVGIK